MEDVKEFKSFFKTVGGNEGNKCHYPTRLDTYGCGCSHDCKYCLDPNTEILMYDGEIKLLKDINIGDEVYGIEQDGVYNKYVKSVVTNKLITNTKSYKIILSNGNELICSGNHQWLTNRGWKYTTGDMTGPDRKPHLTTNNRLVGLNNLFKVSEFKKVFDETLYKLGYLRGVILGDANLKEYHYSRPSKQNDNQYHFRLALKNQKITDRVKKYLDEFDINTYYFDFEMTDRVTKENYIVSAIRTSSQEAFDKINDLIKKVNDPIFKLGFLAGIYDAEGTNNIMTRRISNSNPGIIADIEEALHFYNYTYTFDKDKKCVNEVVKTIRLTGGLADNIKFGLQTGCIVGNEDGVLTNIRLKTNNPENFKIVSIEEYQDSQDLIDITTTTRNFVANGVITHNCYAKSLLDFRNLWDAEHPAVADIEKIRRKIAKLPKDTPAIRLGGMTDCFQPIEKHYRNTYYTIKALNEYKIPYLIVTKGAIVADPEYLEILDKDLAHIQVTVTTTDDDLYRKLNYEKASLPSERIKAIETLQANGFDVQLRLSPFIPQYVDYNVLNNVKCDKILVEFLRVNTWIKKWFDIDYSDWTEKQSGYQHLPLEKKKELLKNITGFKEITVCEDFTEHYDYWKNNFNHNPDDCCNLRKS